MHRHLYRILLSAIIVVLLERRHVRGIDGNSFVPRLNCYPGEQPDCNEEFIVAYPNLSKSVTGLTNATTWFLMFTKRNPENPEKLHECAGNLPPNTNFNPNNRMIVLVTTFTIGMCETAIHREWLVQFLEREDANILAIDFSWGNRFDVETVNQNIKIVAQQTVIVLKNIQKRYPGLKKEQIHLVGLSLGAQLAGQIGHLFPVGTITGIDPGGPGYTEDTPLEYRLDPSDADFVAVWHTNAGQCIPYFAIGYDAGDVDFWINDGLNQPSCIPYIFISLAKGDIFYALGTAILTTLCSHVQSAQYYKVSINPGNCQFVGVKCESYEKFKLGQCRRCGETGDNCLIMGFDTDKYIKNVTFPQRYYVHTSLECPYCNTKCLRLEGYKDTYKSSLQTK